MSCLNVLSKVDSNHELRQRIAFYPLYIPAWRWCSNVPLALSFNLLISLHYVNACLFRSLFLPGL
jgi:hypothetical protein